MVAKRLHGLKWPSHNKRPLEVEFVSREEVGMVCRRAAVRCVSAAVVFK